MWAQLLSKTFDPTFRFVLAKTAHGQETRKSWTAEVLSGPDKKVFLRSETGHTLKKALESLVLLSMHALNVHERFRYAGDPNAVLYLVRGHIGIRMTDDGSEQERESEI